MAKAPRRARRRRRCRPASRAARRSRRSDRGTRRRRPRPASDRRRSSRLVRVVGVSKRDLRYAPRARQQRPRRRRVAHVAVERVFQRRPFGASVRRRAPRVRRSGTTPTLVIVSDTGIQPEPAAVRARHHADSPERRRMPRHSYHARSATFFSAGDVAALKAIRRCASRARRASGADASIARRRAVRSPSVPGGSARRRDRHASDHVARRSCRDGRAWRCRTRAAEPGGCDSNSARHTARVRHGGRRAASYADVSRHCYSTRSSGSLALRCSDEAPCAAVVDAEPG